MRVPVPFKKLLQRARIFLLLEIGKDSLFIVLLQTSQVTVDPQVPYIGFQYTRNLGLVHKTVRRFKCCRIPSPVLRVNVRNQLRMTTGVVGRPADASKYVSVTKPTASDGKTTIHTKSARPEARLSLVLGVECVGQGLNRNG